jgi:hypothetical protein
VDANSPNFEEISLPQVVTSGSIYILSFGVHSNILDAVADTLKEETLSLSQIFLGN